MRFGCELKRGIFSQRKSSFRLTPGGAQSTISDHYLAILGRSMQIQSIVNVLEQLARTTHYHPDFTSIVRQSPVVQTAIQSQSASFLKAQLTPHKRLANECHIVLI